MSNFESKIWENFKQYLRLRPVSACSYKKCIYQRDSIFSAQGPVGLQGEGGPDGYNGVKVRSYCFTA